MYKRQDLRFRKILDASNYIESHILKRKYCIGISLDIQAAFDSIKPHKIKEAILAHVGDKEMVNWYYNYLIHRNIYTEISGTKKTSVQQQAFHRGELIQRISGLLYSTQPYIL